MRRAEPTSAKGRPWATPLTAVLVIALWPGAAFAHEPIFGVGPHTIFQGGVAAEVEGEFSKEAIANVYELAYGVTHSVTITSRLPLLYLHDGDANRFGVGDGQLRFKWRFLRIDSLGAQDSMALVGGIKLPTGNPRGEPPLGTGSTDWLGALTYGHEGRRWYWWTDVRYLLTTEGGGVDRGDVFFYDGAFGVRPWLLRYDQPDLVVLAELNGRHIGAAHTANDAVPNTGGNVLTGGPAIFFTYRNYALKGGIAFPLWHSLRGTQPDPQLEGVVALEAHF